MSEISKTKQQLLLEIEELQQRLAEAEDTLEAIRTGAVDALIVSDKQGEKIFSLQSVDYSYRVMVENINEGAVILDTKGVVVFSNRAFASLAGREMPAIVGNPFHRFLPDLFQKNFASFLEECTDHPCRAEFSLLGPHGDPIPVSISCTLFEAGGTNNICLVVGDLTEHKVAAQKLRDTLAGVEEQVVKRTLELQQKEEEFRSLSENSPDSIARLDSGLRHLYVNPMAKKISGMDITGKTWREAGLPEDFLAFWEGLFKKAIQTGKVEKVDSRYQSSEGLTYFLSSRIVPEFGKDGSARSVLIVSRDITERKKAEADQQRHTAELTAANQNLEAFAFSISHDLRNPLHSILACCDIIKDSILPDDKDGQKGLGLIIQATRRMAQVISDLMSLSRITSQEVKFAKCDLSEMARSIVEELRRRDNLRKVECIIEPGLIAVADEGLMWILLQNILNNAWKFTLKKPEARIEFGRRDGEKSPVYYIRDNGAGFEMKYIDRLFKPFQRLHAQSEFSGTGIGLTIVKRIVEKHGGAIEVEAEKDKGATFFFRLGGGVDAERL